MEKLLAPMSGKIWKIECAEGDTVKVDDVLIVMEAMKMEAEVFSPASGVVKRIAVRQGQDVTEGQTLLEIEA